MLTAIDYHPFGMVMPERKFPVGHAEYRYGFNGQEKSWELNENSFTAEFWQYDSRIVRRWNIDPVVKKNESPYMAFSGNPILLSDPDGADTTLTSVDGGNVNLPSGVSDINIFDGTVQGLQGTGATAHPSKGALASFIINGKKFNAEFGDHTGNFKGYFSEGLSYNDYAAQQNASLANAATAFPLLNLGKLGIAGEGLSTGAALPAIPLAIGGGVGSYYGSTHADKITDWVQAIAGAAAAVIGEEVINDVRTTALPPGRMVEQYALRAKSSGEYPVLTYGNAYMFYEMGIVMQTAHLDAGDVWKYGTTVNPASRYSQTFLLKYNLQYQTEFFGPEQAAIMLESMKIVNHMIIYSAYPHGNTKIR